MHGFEKKELLEMAWEKPILAQVEITSKCNQSCVFCYTGKKSLHEVKELPLLQWQEIIRKLGNLGVRRLDFTGRESFMHPDLTELVAWCKKLGFEVRINTNGTFDVSSALEYVNEIVFSVHGIGKIHDRIVGRRKSFDQIMLNVERASKRKIKTSVNMSLIKSNYHQMLEVFNFFNERFGLHKFAPSFPVLSRFGNAFEDIALVIERDLIEDYMHNLNKIPKDKLTLKHGFHSIFINNPRYYADNGLLLPNCAAGKYKLIVESDGNVFPCNFFKSEEFYCGNILSDDESVIWNSGKGFQKFRSIIIDEKIPQKCSMCLKKPRCFSGCRAWANMYKEGGFEYDRDMRCEIGSAFIGG